ncbi:sporulation protein YpjB [Gracilibacillus halophilus YIM-C55.5]|uniref:Sporulation protein YpjB n=1 Tax=Gracilibacillus halophilus YIM-C55.5 TaxID=1308866 RepID=N4WW61_9BACI|nr:sporulation protein YpjB [Gracilibacillus halophilus]ENH97326.1 sporulation protein YpjB [Gracilibacillus halophilus YIM-C55.5]
MHVKTYGSLILFILIAILVFPLYLQADSNVYQYERYIQENRYDEAKELLQLIEEDMLKNINERAPVHVDIVQKYIDENMQVLHQQDIQKHVVTIRAQQLLLLYDSIITEKDARWVTWKQELTYDLEKLSNEDTIDQSEILQLQRQWEVLSPVFEAHLSEERYQSIEESFLSLGQHKEQVEEAFEQVSLIDLNQFHYTSYQEYFVWLLIIVAGFLFVSLSYVAWVKYRAEGKSGHSN